MSPTFPDIELYAARRFTIVEQEGHADRIWDMPLQVNGTPAAAIMDNEGQIINENIFSDRADDINCILTKALRSTMTMKLFQKISPSQVDQRSK